MDSGEAQVEYGTGEPLGTKPPSPARFSRKGFILPASLIVGGILALTVIDLVEQRHMATQVWRDALFATEGEAPWGGTIAVRARQLPVEVLPYHALLDELDATPNGRYLVEMLQLDVCEKVLAMPLEERAWSAALAWGRLPEPGEPEVLAGPLCRFDVFKLDGEVFRVVGGLQRGSSGFALTYVLPEHKGIQQHFSREAGATTGWFDPNGVERMMSGEVAEDALDGSAGVYGGPVLTSRAVTVCASLAVLAVLVGGVLVQIRLFRILGRRSAVLRPICRVFARHRRLFYALTWINFGLFMGLMFLAIACPLWNLRLVMLIAEAFTEGDLSSIGEAYMSGSIPLAAWETFWQNFVMQTCALSLLPSMLVPFFGIVKNAFSIGLAGFGIAPMWAGTAGQFTFHGITVVLELEAYTVASFIVALYPMYLVKTVVQKRPRVAAMTALRLLRFLGSGTLLAGIILAIAALFEAITLT